jgi:hypothetical protein
MKLGVKVVRRDEKVRCSMTTRELLWRADLYPSNSIYADIGGDLGRYTITCIATRPALRHRGVLLGKFDTLDEAKGRARRGADHARDVKAEGDALDRKGEAAGRVIG